MTRNRFTVIEQRLHLANNDWCNEQEAEAVWNIFKISLHWWTNVSLFWAKLWLKLYCSTPVKFWYKFRVLTNCKGYGYQICISDLPGIQPLSQYVVTELEEAKCHSITFDNFIASYSLVKQLRNIGFRDAGTVPYHRIPMKPLPDLKQMKKKQNVITWRWRCYNHSFVG